MSGVNMTKVLEVKYTKVAPDEPLAPYCIKADLNPALCIVSTRFITEASL